MTDAIDLGCTPPAEISFTLYRPLPPEIGIGDDVRKLVGRNARFGDQYFTVGNAIEGPPGVIRLDVVPAALAEEG